jgi:hypothetical protein
MFSNYSAGGSDIVVVTDTNGITSSFDIPHAMFDLSAHDKAFNEIINGLISLKYEIASYSPLIYSDVIGLKIVTTRTWFLRKLD